MLKTYLEKLRKFIKNLDVNQKIYLATGLFLFFIQFGFQEFYEYSAYPMDTRYLIIWSIVGIVYSTKRRNNARKLINDKPLTTIILNDYSFTAYASLSILSLVYTVFQGILLGLSGGFIFYGVGLFLKPGGYADDVWVNFGYAIASLLALIIVRVIIEAFTLIFRVAEDISKSVNKQNV